MANPITAIASRSCAKNSLLKQTKDEKKDDVTTTGTTRSVSTTADVPQNIGGGRAILGDQTDTTITTPGSSGGTETIYDTGKSLKGLTPEQLAWRENEIKKLGGIDEYHKKYGDSEKGKAREIKAPDTQPTSDTTSDFEIDQKEVKGMENLDLRQEIRSEKALNRLDRQAERRQDRFARKGLSGKEKRDLKKQQKADRRQSNIDRQQDVQNLISQRKAQRDLQRDQGSFGGQNYQIGEVVANKDAMQQMSGMSDVKYSQPTTSQPTPSGKTKVGQIIEGVGNIFDKKEGGTAVGNTLRGVFGAKEGGSFVGNLLRGGKSPSALKKNFFNK
ncbi:hypothetical protein N9D22_05200 [Flavobacteriaceae bacterium]|nr:hypothetical protein [Flavobacteriaceae bacterium]